MQQDSIEPSVVFGVQLATDRLENWELAAFYLAVQIDSDLSKCAGYDKIKLLCTEGNGTKMHGETRRALDCN